jgi:cadmium resistance protein CadD (predicted permease)
MGVIGIAFVAFVVTNVDDLALATAIVVAGSNSKLSMRRLIVGQYLGFVVIIAASDGIAEALHSVRGPYIGLVSLIPLSLGIRGLLSSFDGDTTARSPRLVVSTPVVAVLTIAGGADNVSVYSVLLRRASAAQDAEIAATFMLLLIPLCLLALRLGHAPQTRRALDRFGPIVTPVVLVAIGIAGIANAFIHAG